MSRVIKIGHIECSEDWFKETYLVGNILTSCFDVCGEIIEMTDPVGNYPDTFSAKYLNGVNKGRISGTFIYGAWGKYIPELHGNQLLNRIRNKIRAFAK